MIECYTGRPGAGKTYAMVQRAWRAREAGVDVWANMQLSWARYFRTWEELCVVQNALVMLDEVGLWFNAREFTKLPFEVRSAFSQSRKRGLNVIMTAQNIEQVDAHIRRLVGVLWRCERIGPLMFTYAYDPDEPGGKPYRRVVRVLSRVGYMRYDTYEVVGDAQGEGGGQGGAARAEADRMLRSLLARCDELGRVVYRPATYDDVLAGGDLIRRVQGRWRPAGEEFCGELVRLRFGSLIDQLDGGSFDVENS